MSKQSTSKSVEIVSFDPLARLLKQAVPSKAVELDAILARLSPVCELDRDSERVLFQAHLNPAVIRVGLQCTCRLEAHAYVAGIFLSAFCTPGYLKMTRDQKHVLYAPADHLLNWAVSRDLSQFLVASGVDVWPEDLLEGLGKELPPGLLAGLNEQQRVLGRGMFCYSTAFILLHELAHLHFGHTYCEGAWSIQQERDADRFAAEWLVESASQSKRCSATRLNALNGISVALLWLTVFNVYFGPRRSSTHPEGYDRLFTELDNVIDATDEKESSMVWYLVSCLLFVHMDNAGFEFDPARMQGSPRDEVNYLIDPVLFTNRVLGWLDGMPIGR
jgi:hypothetical protein